MQRSTLEREDAACFLFGHGSGAYLYVLPCYPRIQNPRLPTPPGRNKKIMHTGFPSFSVNKPLDFHHLYPQHSQSFQQHELQNGKQQPI